MSIHRRPVGQARRLSAIGAIVVLIGCVLPWWGVGGLEGLPALSGNAFAGMGIVVFVVALAVIALVTLPYATDRPVAVDRWPAHAGLAVVGWLAFGIRIVDLLALRAFDIREPVEAFTDVPGLWITGIGLAILARAAYDVWRDPNPR